MASPAPSHTHSLRAESWSEFGRFGELPETLAYSDETCRAVAAPERLAISPRTGCEACATIDSPDVAARVEVTMPSFFAPVPTQRNRRVSAVLTSAAMHGALLALVLVAGKALKNRVMEPTTQYQFISMVENAGAAHASKFPLPPMDLNAQKRHPDPSPEVTHKSLLPVENARPKVAGGGAPTNPHNGNGSGHALAGNGEDDEDRHPAFPVFSPHPPVKDRSLLPSTEQKIVVDVSLNEAGQVVSETLVKGMGTQLDKIVMDIALTWRFQPATVNGKPVPSEAELIFPFNQEYPIAEG